MQNNSKLVIFRNSNIKIPNIFECKKLGAGHDGTVYQSGNEALKILKYDIEKRRQQDLMTFTKACYFVDNLELKRIAAPTDTLLDEEGVYVGYVMPYFHDVTKPHKKDEIPEKTIADFTCGDLFKSIEELQQDIDELSVNRVRMEDLNRYSFIYANDFLRLCDTDKYSITKNNPKFYNDTQLRFIIAKFLLYQVQGNEKSPDQIKKYAEWCKKNINDVNFFDKLRKEIYELYDSTIGEYVDYKRKEINR